MATLDLVMRPPPPLGARQTLYVVGGVAALMTLGALRFLLIGAWPVLPFLIVDLALLVWAFRASARSSKARERLRLIGGELVLDRIGPDGRTQRLTLPRAGTGVELERLSPPENRLWLNHDGRRLPVGHFLSPSERAEVFVLIEQALSRD